MQKLQPTFFSELIEQVFDRIETRLASLSVKKLTADELTELDCLFQGEVLCKALHIVDKYLVISYRPENGISEVIEITELWSSPIVHKLFPNTNFCHCKFFTDNILYATEKSYYTCEHVLAARLAKFLDKLKMHNSKILYEKGVLKNRTMLTQSQYPDFKFVGRLDKIKAFHAGIKAISFGETAKFHINENGFRIIVENAKSIQASLFITTEVFEEFHLEADVCFSVNMNVLVECISIFTGNDYTMKIYYKGEGAPLMLVIDHNDDPDVTTECSIKTARYEDSTEYSLNEDSSTYNIIFIRGPDLSQIFSDIDKTADELEFTLSPKEPHFRIATIGVMQAESNVEVAKTSDMMILFNCRDTTVARYKCSHMRLTSKALSASSKVAIKTDSSGLMELHFMVYSNDEAQVYIQFFILPVVDEN